MVESPTYYCPYLHYSLSEENAQKCYYRSDKACKYAKSSCLIQLFSTSTSYLERTSSELSTSANKSPIEQN